MSYILILTLTHIPAISPTFDSARSPFSSQTHYEHKAYNKAVREADKVLARNEKHCETLVVKGASLVLAAPKANVAQKAEGFALMKKGLMFNLKSSTAWHVQALVYRAEHQYAEAVKSYTMALRFDETNSNLVRDLALLQAQTHAFEGLVESRRKLLIANPAVRANWSGYAVASHLAGRHDVAAQTVSAFLSTMPPGADGMAKLKHEAKFENSEMHLFRNELLAAKGDVAAAYADLDAIKPVVIDTLSWHALRGKHALTLGHAAEAEAAYRWLLDTNPENREYYDGLVAAKGLAYTPAAAAAGLPETQVAALTELFTELKAKFPKCLTVQRVPLDFLPAGSPAFAAALETYVVPRLRNAMPSLFRDLSSLYAADAAKQTAIGALMTGFAESLPSTGRFSSTVALPAGASEESPVAVLWVFIYLALHCDYAGDSAAALVWLAKGQAHSPTLLDLNVFKAGVLKHAGDAAGAYAACDAARVMDLADRYVNTKTTQYALQAGCDEAGENTMALFLRDDMSLFGLVDLQVSWFVSQMALCYRGKPGQWRALALRKFKDVENIFDSFVESQLDFHHYVYRKSTLRAYAQQMVYLASVRQHKFYVRAMGVAAELWLELHDEKLKASTADAAVAAERAEIETTVMSRAQNVERSKFIAESEEKAAKALTDTPFEAPDREDTLGFALMDTAEPLAEAARLVTVLTTASAGSVTASAGVSPSVWLLAARVHMRRGKLLLALRALRHARAGAAALAGARATGETAKSKASAGASWPAVFGLAHAHAATKATALPVFLAVEADAVAAELLAAAAARGPEADAVSAAVFADAVAAGADFPGAAAVSADAAAALAARVAAGATRAGASVLERAAAASAAVRLYSDAQSPFASAADATKSRTAAAAAVAAAVTAAAAEAPSTLNAAVRCAVRVAHAALAAAGAAAASDAETVRGVARAAFACDEEFMTAAEKEEHAKAYAVVPPAYSSTDEPKPKTEASA